MLTHFKSHLMDDQLIILKAIRRLRLLWPAAGCRREQEYFAGVTLVFFVWVVIISCACFINIMCAFPQNHQIFSFAAVNQALPVSQGAVVL